MTGKQLRRIRKQELGLSQAKLAVEMKVTSGHIARLERGERAITGLFEVALAYVRLTHKLEFIEQIRSEGRAGRKAVA